MTLAEETQAASSAAGTGARRWEPVCPVELLTPDRGVAALVAGEQVAVFLLGGGEVYALDDVDPFSGAAVLSRGLVGDVDGAPTVASPIYKQRFDLRTGRCIDDGTTSVKTWDARVHEGCLEVALP
ncbi:MAG: nitrite reductase small subunit NirD [Actinomycetota bacterium]